MTEPRMPRERRLSGIADVTRIGPPELAGPHQQVQPDVQGTLALDFHPEVPVRRRPALNSVAGEREELERFTKRLCTAVVEVLAGDRGPAQLLQLVDERVYADLVSRGRALAGIGGVDQRLHRPRARIRSVRVFCPSAGAAEFGMHVRHGERSRAVAGRLELHDDGGWVCVALEFG